MTQIRTAHFRTDLPKNHANEKNSRFAVQSLHLAILIFFEATRGFEKLRLNEDQRLLHIRRQVISERSGKIRFLIAIQPDFQQRLFRAIQPWLFGTTGEFFGRNQSSR